MGRLLNVSLQVCLDVWNEMWFLLTLVTADTHLGRGGMSFTFGEKKKKKKLEQFKWNDLVISFLGILSLFKLHPRNVHSGTPLTALTKSTSETSSETSITWCKCEWNRAWWVRLPSSHFQPGLINSNKFREVISDDARQAGSHSSVVYYFTLPWAQSLTFATLKGHEVKFYSQI